MPARDSRDHGTPVRAGLLSLTQGDEFQRASGAPRSLGGPRARRDTAQLVVLFVGIQLALSVFSRSDYLFTSVAITASGNGPSDVARMADALFLPYWVWGLVCGGFSVWVLWKGLQTFLRDTA